MARVEAYQHLLPSCPGARIVHDGQAVGFSWRTASAEAKHVKAFPCGIEVSIADAANNDRSDIRIDAGHRASCRSGFLPSAKTRAIFMWTTIILILTLQRPNLGVK